MSTLEQTIADGFANAVGDISIIGILVLVFFGVFVMLQNTRLDHKLAIMVPATILACAFIPWMAVVLALTLGGVIYLGIMKLITR